MSKRKTHSGVYYDSKVAHQDKFWNTSETWTHIDPPTNTQSAHEISDKYSQKTVNDPIMRDTDVAQVMGGERYLVPKESQEERARHVPLVIITKREQNHKQGISSNFWTIASEISAFVETSIYDTLVKSLVGRRMLSLNLRRKQVGGGLDRRESWA